jgi:hypothetical protein
MWLSILIIVALVGGIALAVGGIGILGFPLLIVGIAGLGILLAQRASGSKEQSGGRVPAVQDDPSKPQDTGHAGTHRKTGVAHPGQEHMVP